MEPRNIYLAHIHEHWMNRQIVSIYFEDGEGWSIRRETVDSIAAYSEPGEMSMTIWFEVRLKNGSSVRVNGSHIAQVGFQEQTS